MVSSLALIELQFIPRVTMKAYVTEPNMSTHHTFTNILLCSHARSLDHTSARAHTHTHLKCLQNYVHTIYAPKSSPGSVIMMHGIAFESSARFTSSRASVTAMDLLEVNEFVESHEDEEANMIRGAVCARALFRMNPDH